MTQKPKNMTRVLLSTDYGQILSFAFYKDGMFLSDDDNDWHKPEEFDGWININELKVKLNIN